jgi:hypothetical protein
MWSDGVENARSQRTTSAGREKEAGGGNRTRIISRLAGGAGLAGAAPGLLLAQRQEQQGAGPRAAPPHRRVRSGAGSSGLRGPGRHRRCRLSLPAPAAPGHRHLLLLPHPARRADGRCLPQCGNSGRSGERQWNRAARRRREGVSIPIKDCPVCVCSGPCAAQQCPDCGHLFLTDERDEQRRGSSKLRANRSRSAAPPATGPSRTCSSGPGAAIQQLAAASLSSCCSASRSGARIDPWPGTSGRRVNAAPRQRLG